MRKPIRHNPMAKALASPLYRLRIVAAKKGKGSYSRKSTRPTDRNGR